MSCFNYCSIQNSVFANSYADEHKIYKCSGESKEDSSLEEEISPQFGSYMYDNYMEAYFDRLTRNFGENIKGSCGYVALAMILSYYDNYLNDNIVDEDYDVNAENTTKNFVYSSSPGTMYDNYYEELNDDDEKKYGAENYYYNFVQQYAKYSLHAKHILLGNTYHNTYNFNDNSSPCGVTLSDLIMIARTYLQVERAYREEMDFSFTYKGSGSSETIKQFIIEQIDAGFPIIVSVGKNKGKGEENGEEYHACVAFAHNDSGEIYFHSGWHNGARVVTLKEMEYEFIEEAFTLRFSLQHSHTNNYVVEENGVSTAYCYCDHRIITYKQTEHTYNSRYKPYNDTYHKAYCVCGEYTTEKHVWQPYNKPATMIGDYVQCKNCKFIKKLSGDIIVPSLPTRKKNLMFV